MKAKDDPLASPTLAQLYLSQGHRNKARGTVNELLGQDPLWGEALVLRERLDAGTLCRLELEVDREVILRWSIPSDRFGRLERPASLVLCAQAAQGDRAPYYLSGAVDKAIGEMHLPFAFARGSASACLATLAGPRREFQVLAVATSASW